MAIGSHFLIQTLPAMAHPGHGHTPPESASHYVLEPVHLAPLAAIALCTAATYSLWRWRKRALQQDKT